MINPVWNPFSRYADKLEKKLDRLLRRIGYIGVFEAQEKILSLMQKNLVITNLWLEAKFKGYKYLSRRRRKRMYLNSEKISSMFLRFAETNNVDIKSVKTRISALKCFIPSASGDEAKLLFLTQIMAFLSPLSNRFKYLKGASFGKLLTNPDRNEEMAGDCNQIVTFYVFLYSLKFPISDLQIKLLPGHVCLHFKGIDIEATSGSFANYTEESSVLPIVELIATNLLDVSDFRDKQIKVNPSEFLRGAQLAYHLSSDRELVTKNLQSAYHNATLYYVKNNSFSSARFYAKKSSNPDLIKYVDENEGIYLYKNGSISKARTLFERIGNKQMVKACYIKEYNSIQSRVASLKTRQEILNHKKDYQKMLDLAIKMEEYTLVTNLRKILNEI